MTQPATQYAVFLRSDLSNTDKFLLSKFARKAPTQAGEVLFFHCTDIDLSHHVFLRMEAIREVDNGVYTVRIPHNAVALIAGDQSSRSIGFLADLGEQ